jgi:ribosome-binding protein aMBF1 (putative translation factor)
MVKTRNFVTMLRKRLAANPKLAAAVEQEELNAHVATQIFEARMAAGLTQKQLAGRIGTRQSVIARLEDADYSGHSLSMLRRIATALGCSLAVELSPKTHLHKRASKKTTFKRTT